MKNLYLEAVKTDSQEEFLKKHDCSATLEEAVAFIDAKKGQDEELSLDELDSVAGGTANGCQKDNTNSGTSAQVVVSAIEIGGLLQTVVKS